MRRFLYMLMGVFLLLPSCTKDFEEINQNPFYPTQTDIGPLFNTVVNSLRLGWNEQFYMHNETLYGVTQLAAKTAVGFDNITIGTEEAWGNYYKALAHIREIEERLDAMEVEEEALNNVRAQLKVLLAYKTFRITDLFGDMPFFDAGRGFESLDFARPKFDTQEEIYKYLLEDLKWVEDHINTVPNPTTASGEPYVSFGDFDNLFNADMLQDNKSLVRWRKFANSLRLRYAMRMVEKDPAFAKPILQEIIDNKLPVIEEGEEVIMSPAQQDWRNESVIWSFAEHKKLRMGSNVWHQLSENDNTDGSGIFDPRARIFFETNNADKWVPFPQFPDANTPTEGGIPYGQHRDSNYPIKGADNLYSPFNYYLVRDEKDIPEIMLTAAEVHFIKAEAYMRGLGVAMDISEAEGEYTLGVVASITFWQNVAKGSAIWENKPPILSEGEIFAAVNHPRLSIFTSNDKLQLIYTQRWLDAFRQPWEAYSLWRRTGATPREGTAPEYYRFSYPPSEASNNPENWSAQVGRMGDDSPKTKVWWMP
ncbi:MAG: SusD/RagB family nutrient-binding outer membrane lipoprotein [Lewinellaceae bacterium]|nr:SusD/RagB family nutrient-binding outer membrane lipoprotein [Saprospiraceae bacterium]MCB9337173.1 SusD/RagB family nutrient-binding outer membrane lipoprotein [Lewinellaceae bacterium]